MKSVGILFSILLLSTFTFASEFKDCTYLKNECFTLQNFPNQSFVLKAPIKKDKPAKLAVIAHGLSDGPYFTKDLALLLHLQGYNVYSVRLTGHGTRVEDLLNIKSTQWISDIKNTISLGMKETGAKQVLLAGFSLGGALVSNFAINDHWKRKLSGMILMAPAFQIQKNLGRAMCATGAYHLKTWAWDDPQKTSPIKYNKMTFKAVCELVDIGAIIRENAQRITSPVFMAVTDGDQTIRTDIAVDTLKVMKSKKKKLYRIVSTNVSHTDIMFKSDPISHRQNPQFRDMSQKIIQFLK